MNRAFILVMVTLTLVAVDVAAQREGRRGAPPSGGAATQTPQQALCRGMGRIQSAALSGFKPLDAGEPPDPAGWRKSIASLPGSSSCRYRLTPDTEHMCTFQTTPQRVVAQGDSLVRAVASCVGVTDGDTIDFGTGFITSFEARGFDFVVSAAEPEKNAQATLTLTISRR